MPFTIPKRASLRLAPLLAIVALSISLQVFPIHVATASTATTPPPRELPSFYSEPDPLPRGPAGTLVKAVVRSRQHSEIYARITKSALEKKCRYSTKRWAIVENG